MSNWVCTCIRLDCWHPKGECDEPPTIRGGVCTTCRYHRDPFAKCPLCGQPERREDFVSGVCMTCAEGITFGMNTRRGGIVIRKGTDQ